jgi:hypothetical protein
MASTETRLIKRAQVDSVKNSQTLNVLRWRVVPQLFRAGDRRPKLLPPCRLGVPSGKLRKRSTLAASRRLAVAGGTPRALRTSLSAHRNQQGLVECLVVRLFHLGPPWAALRFCAGHPARLHARLKGCGRRRASQGRVVATGNEGIHWPRGLPLPGRCLNCLNGNEARLLHNHARDW